MYWPLTTSSALAAPVPLFDGKTLEGWEIRKGEEVWWSVQDGCITGGSMEKKVPHNTFLASNKRYANFELKFKVRLVKGDGFMNSGIQVRSIRVADGNNPEMSGYQVDAGINWWGKIYDESRRNKVIAEPVDPEALAKVVKDWDWNEYVIRCEGPRIRSWINGQAALDFVEKDPNIPLEGRIGFQAHGGGRFLVQFKDVTIEELPATPGAERWPPKGPQRPEDQKAYFNLPEGFEAELVASEEQGVGKPITVAWDAQGRMWTMTAYEYPVDANESKVEAEALYARGGKDKVLVFDNPNGPGPHTPRVFAEGLGHSARHVAGGERGAGAVWVGDPLLRGQERGREGRWVQDRAGWLWDSGFPPLPAPIRAGPGGVGLSRARIVQPLDREASGRTGLCRWRQGEAFPPVQAGPFPDRWK